MAKVKKQWGKLNKIALVIAAVHFLLSFFTDRFVFDYVLFNVSNTKLLLRSGEAWLVKLFFGGLLVFLWQWIFYLFKKENKTFLKVTGIYWGAMMLLLLMTWPGIWRMDEFGILSASVQLFPHFWQNYITSVFYVLALMLLPFPAGVVVIQCLVIALAVARVVTLCAEHSGEKWKHAWILLLPFFMFPVLDSNLYPIRMSVYAFLELLLITELFFLTKQRKENACYWFWISLLAAVVTVWRTESVYYVLAYPVLLLLIGKGKQYKKQMLLYLIAFVILFTPQKLGEKLTSGDQYELTSVVLPLVPLVEAAAEDGREDLLVPVDKVVNVEVTLEGAARGKSGINLFWGEPEFQREYTSEEFAEFKSGFYKLAMEYPMVFLEERWQTFLDSSDLLENTTELFSAEGVANYEVFQTYPLTKPLNNDLRTSVIKILELRSADQYEKKLPFTNGVYSAIPAVLVLAVAAAVMLLKKRWAVSVLLLTVLAKVPLVFLTAPSRLFMYYYSVYLIGYFVLFYALYLQMCKKGGTGNGKTE